MAPRESTNNFADQFLCLDYEGGVAMLPHDPTPPIALDADDEDENEHDDVSDNNNNSPGTGNSTADTGTNTLNSTRGGVSNHGSGGVSPSGQSQSPIDPLSIDPTSDEMNMDFGGGDIGILSGSDVGQGVVNAEGDAQLQQDTVLRRRRTLGRFLLPVTDVQHPTTVSPLNSGYSGIISVDSSNTSDDDNNQANHDGVFLPPSPARTASTNSTNINTNTLTSQRPAGGTSGLYQSVLTFPNSRASRLSRSSRRVSQTDVEDSNALPDLDTTDDASVDDQDGSATGSAFSEASPSVATSALTGLASDDDEPIIMDRAVTTVASSPASPGRSIRRNAAFDEYALGQSPMSNSSPTRIATRLTSAASDPIQHHVRGQTSQTHDVSSPGLVASGSLSVSSQGSTGRMSDVSAAAAQPILSFGPNTTLADLKYFAERGCIVALLSALNTPKLTALGARMLADYAKNPARRVAVAGNKRILEFTMRTMCGRIGNSPNLGVSIASASQDNLPSGVGGNDRSEVVSRERAVEYAVETIRSLTATEESDRFLMNTPGLLQVLAMLASGGFVSGTGTHDGNASTQPETPPISPVSSPRQSVSPSARSRGSMIRSISRSTSRSSVGSTGSTGANRATSPGGADRNSSSASPNSPQVMINSKSRLHACIAVMNLSCGKSNKTEIAKIPQVLNAMRDVMTDAQLSFTSHSRAHSSSNHAAEARLKATTCIKNLSNADANDSALLNTSGLIEALGHVILVCIRGNASEAGSEEDETSRRGAAARATTTVTNACLALMNLSIAKANKHKVFQTPGVMEALMAVITKGSGEARVKSCSALSNLAIGYDNKIPMFCYPGFVEAILHVIEVDRGEARTKACSILWSFAAEMRNQVPVVQRGDILPVLVQVAAEDATTEARFKCVAALTLLAESVENAMPLLKSGALAPLMEILHEAGPDPTQWKGQTASWCVGFLMNMAQSDEAVPSLRNAGVVELLAPLLTLDHYQSLKAAMAVTFVCRYDEGDETYDLLRKTETVIPKIINLLHNTLSGKGGNGYKYGVFTLRSSVGCIASLASGPDFMKERMATGPVFESLLRVLSDFCVDCTPGAIVGGGKDDAVSPSLAIQALHDLTGHLIPTPGTPFPFGSVIEERLITALSAFERNSHRELKPTTKQLAKEIRLMLMGYGLKSNSEEELAVNMTMSAAPFCCADFNRLISPSPVAEQQPAEVAPVEEENGTEPVRTFLLSDGKGRRFAVPTDPSGGRTFNDNRVWCYRRGRFCLPGEVPDPSFRWTPELQSAYMSALAVQRQHSSNKSGKDSLGGSLPFC